jgi:metalloendopeptidase OMA1, mitochondrial
MPMKLPFLAPLLALLLFATGCTTVPETGRKQVMLISSDEEAKMGLSAFSQIKSQEKISNDPAANAQVRRVGERIARSVGRELPNAQWEFVVFDSPQVNAFALPGGKVGVYTGLLKLVGSDDELASVMGHEVAHVTSRHGGERASQQMLATGLTVASAVYLETRDMDPAKKGLILAGIGGGAALGVILPYSRLHESEADAIGLRFASGAGYDPRAAATFWEKMAAANRGKSAPPKWFSTHPPDDERIANLKKLAPQYIPIYERAKVQYQ